MTTDRAGIPAEYKWDLSAIYADMAAFDADYKRAQALVKAFPKHKKTMSKSAAGLLDCLKATTEIGSVIEKLYEYAFLNSDTDLADNTYLSLKGKVMNLYNAYSSAAFFVSPSLIKLDSQLLDKWYSELPELEGYRRIIDKEQRCKPYTLSDECEKLMADLGEAFDSHSQIRTVFANADLSFGKIAGEDGKKVELTDATYVPFLMSQDRNVRRRAFTKLYETYSKYGNTFSSLYNAYVKESTAVAKVRHFDNSLQASVFGDEVTPDIYNNLIATVNKNLPVLFKYYELKKQLLGVQQLHLYDIYTPLIAECDSKYTFEQAKAEVLDTVKVFGPEYHDTLEAGYEKNRWVDVYPSRGKQGGAYSAGGGPSGVQPYILLNYTETLDDVSTLAHESGHSMHTYFSTNYNTPQEAEYTIFVAEVASTVNELLFCHKKLRESNGKAEKLSVLNQIMETYKGTLYRQTMFAEFEKDMHALVEKGETLTQELLCKKYYKLVKRYFGANVVCDRQIAYEWMRIPHFYRNFYVYKYATCISAASSIVKKIEERGEEYISKYIDFLKCGNSRSPLDSLKVAEIDLTDPAVIEDAIADFDSAIEQFKELNK